MTPPPDALIDDLLQATSRTFALAIPLLPEPLRREVGLAYLLFRIADTLEDAELLSRDERIRELGRFIELLGEPTEANARQAAAAWSRTPPSADPEYNRLLAEAPAVIGRLNGLESAAGGSLKRNVIRSALGMADTLRGADARGALRLPDFDALRRYCYFVAGIVGEMLTELFVLRLAPSAERDALAADAAPFGEGLQLVNILKDAPDDARHGRVYLPAGVDRQRVFDAARDDLVAAERYADNLAAAGADPGVVAFATLPRTLAEATLDVIESGAGVKVSREVVAQKVAETLAITGASP
ncbi:squalene/phytoene synthase family protein [Botrimarina sp.]|uniref:squalene/phytoene synthase family protein n=1 Tax=Botrimarina sp. TaxID=2795802 RepID=UPI0032EAEEBA